MKLSQTVVAATTLVGHAVAFPAMMQELAKKSKIPLEARANPSISGTYVLDPAQVAQYFNPAEQYVSNTGQYAFVAPTSTDQRGPCPGLNAMANHGYLPHNGVATIQQFITGTSAVFGMGADLATFLAVYGAVMDGNTMAWSIGGPTPNLPSLPLLLGTPQGISGSHNKYESDVSPVRGDLYEYGNDYLARVPQFQELYAYQSSVSNAQSNYNLYVLQQHRAARFQESISGNPYFFNGPFTGVAVQPAAYTFIYRFMANKSAEHPEGQLTQEVLKDFFSMTGPDASGNFVYTPGYEKIPNNWYKRSPTISPYTIPFFQQDLLQEASVYPQFLDIGGNTGTVNSFVGVDVTALTDGVYNANNLTPQNVVCLAFESIVQMAPDLLEGLFIDTTTPMSTLSNAVYAAESAAGLTCPKLVSIDKSQFSKYPGYTKSGGAARI